MLLWGVCVYIKRTYVWSVIICGGELTGLLAGLMDGTDGWDGMGGNGKAWLTELLLLAGFGADEQGS